jgi:hypothetical protein
MSKPHIHLIGGPADNWFTRQFGLIVTWPLCHASFTGERYYDLITVNRDECTCGKCIERSVKPATHTGGSK